MFNKVTGELRDAAVELDFLHANWESTRKQLIVIMSIGLVAIALLIATNLGDDRTTEIRPYLLSTRIGQFIGLLLIVLSALKKVRPVFISEVILLAQLLSLIAEGTNFVLAYAPLRQGDSTEMPFMVLLLFVYYTIIPSRFVYTMVIGLATMLIYLVLIKISFNHSPAVIVYLFLMFMFVNVLGIGYGRLLNRLKRQEYINQKQIKAEVAQRQIAEQEAITAKKIAEVASEQKSKFIAVAGHDLRQPLHALGLWIDTLKDKIEQKDTKDISEVMDRAIIAKDSLDGLLDRLLHISHLEAGITDLQVEAVDVGKMFEDLKIRFSKAADKRGIDLRVQSLHCILESDPQLLMRILDNLVDNAIKYNRKGGSVLLGVRRQGDHMAIQVWNTGEGIPVSALESIFEEYHQLERIDKQSIRGLGLGLSIVKKLAELLNHPLRAVSTVNRATMFELKVPVSDRAAIDTVESHAANYSKLELKILVIDDDEEVRAAMTSVLSRWGATVYLAEGKTEAINIAEKYALDVIITDQQLSADESGIQLVEALKHQFKLDVPVILLSGDTTQLGVTAAAASGFVVLTKPVKPAVLRMVLNQATRAKLSSVS